MPLDIRAAQWVYPRAPRRASSVEGTMITLNPTVNPYLFGSFVLMGFWSVGLFVVRRRHDVADLREFWWSSFACALLGVTEPLFVPEYWSPPSVLQIGRWDLESF